MPEGTKQHRRSLTSFSLRTALIALTVLGIWLGMHWRSVGQQRAAVEALGAHGGYILYDCEAVGTPPSTGVSQQQTQRNSPVPKWLLSTLGHDHFHSVVQFSTFKPSGVDSSRQLHAREMLRYLSGLPRLQVLELHLTPVDDESLKTISELKQLRRLKLARAMDVTDEGVLSLSQLRSLEHLEMNYSHLTDRSAKAISGLENLEILSLEGQFSEESLQHIRQLKSLRKLTLVGFQGTEVGDEGIVHLRSMTRLKELALWRLPIAENGIRHPEPLQNPQGLGLR